MQSWLEGRIWVGKCAQATGMTASLRILSSRPGSTGGGGGGGGGRVGLAHPIRSLAHPGPTHNSQSQNCCDIQLRFIYFFFFVFLPPTPTYVLILYFRASGSCYQYARNWNPFEWALAPFTFDLAITRTVLCVKGEHLTRSDICQWAKNLLMHGLVSLSGVVQGIFRYTAYHIWYVCRLCGYPLLNTLWCAFSSASH